jgi:hypothetical protein
MYGKKLTSSFSSHIYTQFNSPCIIDLIVKTKCLFLGEKKTSQPWINKDFLDGTPKHNHKVIKI